MTFWRDITDTIGAVSPTTPPGSGRVRGPPGGGPPLPSPIPPWPGGAGGIYNPPLTWDRSVETQLLVVGGANNPIRVVYGRTWLGGDIAGIVTDPWTFDLIVLYVWCEGEVDAVEKMKINGADVASPITATHYTGTLTQGIDPTLSNAYLHRTPSYTYTDTLPGVCYSVVRVPYGSCTGFPQGTALIRGKKVSLTSGGAKSYSDNGGYCMADFIENTTYGMARSVDWTSVAAVAADCDTLVGSPSEKKRIFSLVIDSSREVTDWLKVMSDYAGCWAIPEGSSYRLVPDVTGTAGSPKSITAIAQELNPMVTAPSHGFSDGSIVKIAGAGGMTQINGTVAVVEHFDTSQFRLRGVDSTSYSAFTSGGTVTQIGTSVYSFDESNIQAGTFRLQKTGNLSAPTVVEVDYTVTKSYPWTTDTTDPVYVDGVYDSPPTVPFRRARISKPGILRKSEATRFAIQMLNAAQLNDLSVQFNAFDVAIKLQVGDMIDVTHSLGLSAKIMRLTQATPNEPGRWSLSATEHDDAQYSTVVVDDPDVVDTILPSPMEPPAMGTLTLDQDSFQDQADAWHSRIKVSWTAPVYPFVGLYEITVAYIPGVGPVHLYEKSQTATTSYFTGELPIGVELTVSVAIRSTLGVLGDMATATITLASVP